MRTTALATLALTALATVLAGCEDLGAPAEPPALDRAYFHCKVQPVLVESCAALACHGDTARFYRVFGRNRLRYGLPSEQRNATLLAQEEDFNYLSAIAFVDPTDPELSFLLAKPLDQAGGGFYHGGATLYGKGDVFLSKDDEDYATVRAWIQGAKEDPACKAPGE